MESAEQSTKDLHQKIRKPLEELGHRTSTIPPQNTLPLTEEAREWIEEKTHDAVHFAHTSINPEDTAKIRLARESEPTNIVKKRWSQLKGVFKKAA